jgi:polyisoprenoid-binding protein YceI
MADITMKQVKKTIPKDVMRVVVTALLGAIVFGILTVGYIWFSGGDGRTSEPIAAPSLNIQPGDSRVLFTIIPEQSEARFRIDEVLLGDPKTVVGTTDQIAGEILVDWDDPANSQLGLIRVNVRTFSTDNEFRNRALRGQILEADQDEYEFADFIPVELLQLPSSIAVGDSVAFQIRGNLTVHGVTREVIFDATLTIVSENHIEGNAQTTVRYQDFDVTIPEAPGVANVSDQVEVEISFVAQALVE